MINTTALRGRMINTTALIIDVSHLAWQAHHTTGGLRWGGDPTGVTYGFLRQLLGLQKLYQTQHCYFAFDKAPYHRSKLHSTYKKKVVANDPALAEAKRLVRQQVDALEAEHLPSLGYTNIFAEPGYEADDGCAVFVSALLRERPRPDCVLVSADRDLYQLLGPSVSMHVPRRKGRRGSVPVVADYRYTYTDLDRDFGVTPDAWARVKAIAGCPGDNVLGVEGVAEKTAAAFISGKHNKIQTHRLKLLQAGLEDGVVERNLPLVKLPFEGCPVPTLTKDDPSPKKLRKLCERLGFRSLEGV